jgi:hypothetical protein
MSEELQQALKILAIVFIFGVVAYSILFFDDDHAEF